MENLFKKYLIIAFVVLGLSACDLELKPIVPTPDPEPEPEPIKEYFSSLQLTTSLGSATLLSQNAQGVCLLMTPGTTIGSCTLSYELSMPGELFLADVPTPTGTAKLDFSLPQSCRIAWEGGGESTFTMSVVFCEDLPTFYVLTPGKQSINDKYTDIEGTQFVYCGVDAAVLDLGSGSTRGRGNSTWNMYPKKPYNVKLDKKADIPGLPHGKSFALLAQWMDRTLLRNDVSFEIARRSPGLEWTPTGIFVELVLNGRHNGNYYLCEKIKLSEERINLSSAGYILELDTNYDDTYKFKSSRFSLPVMVSDWENQDNPDYLPNSVFTAIKNDFNAVETSLKTSISSGAFTQLIDIDSYIDWWFVHELTCNAEPNHPKSTYMYKDEGQPFKCGPVWDFDWQTFTPTLANKYTIKTSVWYSSLFNSSVFKTRLKQKWQEQRDAYLDVENYIVTRAQALQKSQESNFKQWPVNSSTTNGDERLSYDAAIERMKSAYVTKFNYLDTNIPKL